MAMPPTSPALIIARDEGTWRASIANTEVNWTFVGDTVEEQYESVRTLARLMSEGIHELMPELVNIFVDIGNPAISYTQMFRGTSRLFLEDELAYSVLDPGDSLADFLERAGADLLELLV